MAKFNPYNLCCALGSLWGRCLVCNKDMCHDCFYIDHVKGDSMFCGNIRLFWKTLNFANPNDPAGHELHPVEVDHGS